MSHCRRLFLYHDKINYLSLDIRKAGTPFSNRALFNDQDLILINGNHFTAQKQVVIIHPNKSLEGKLDKLNDVELILVSEGVEIPDFLKAHLIGKEDIPVFGLNNTAQITAFFLSYLNAAITPLNGLVLAGGKSTRMQADKGNITYHGKTQRDHMFDMLSPFCSEVFISGDRQGNHNTIEDAFVWLGPYGGILSAMQKKPKCCLVDRCLRSSILICKKPLIF